MTLTLKSPKEVFDAADAERERAIERVLRLFKHDTGQSRGVRLVAALKELAETHDERHTAEMDRIEHILKRIMEPPRHISAAEAGTMLHEAIERAFAADPNLVAVGVSRQAGIPSTFILDTETRDKEGSKS